MTRFAPPSVAESVGLQPTEASAAGRNYEAANGTVIKNYGERLVGGFTDLDDEVSMAMQIADVTKTLGSVYRMNEAQHGVWLDGKDSYMLNKPTGRKTPIRMETDRFLFTTWVKKNGRKVQEVAKVETENSFEVLAVDEEDSGFR